MVHIWTVEAAKAAKLRAIQVNLEKTPIGWRGLRTKQSGFFIQRISIKSAFCSHKTHGLHCSRHNLRLSL